MRSRRSIYLAGRPDLDSKRSAPRAGRAEDDNFFLAALDDRIVASALFGTFSTHAGSSTVLVAISTVVSGYTYGLI